MKRNEVVRTALRKGEAGTVNSIRAGHVRGRVFEKRLLDMGLTPGTKLTVVKSAPFHRPFKIYVRGSRLALGRELANRIFAEKEKE